MAKINKEQIAQWKKEHGDVFEIAVEDKKCYLKKPDRKTLSFAMVGAEANPFQPAEVILENCWLGGDEAIKTDDSLFLAAAGQIDELIDIKEATIKKL
jgi:hypothetical protein